MFVLFSIVKQNILISHILARLLSKILASENQNKKIHIGRPLADTPTFSEQIHGKSWIHTSLSPQSLSVAPVLSVFVVLLCVSSPLSHSRWETWGHTHQPMESEHLQMKTQLMMSPNIATHSQFNEP